MMILTVFWFFLLESFTFDVVASSTSAANDGGATLDLTNDISVCERDIRFLLSSMTVFNHPDLKDDAYKAFSSCLKSDFYPYECITDNTEFELICQALGGQMTSQQMVVSCGSSNEYDDHTVIDNAPNCIPKSCNLNMFKKELSMIYAKNAEHHLNQITRERKCKVSPDFCESDTFNLLGTLDVFRHPLLREGLAHAFNSCDFRSDGTFKTDCLMDTAYFEEACEKMGGQMITHHLEMKCNRSPNQLIQFFNSPNCVAKSCDVSLQSNWNRISSSYSVALEVITDSWSGSGSFLMSSVNSHERYPSTSSSYSYNRWIPRNPGVCDVSFKMSKIPKLLLPAKMTPQAASSRNNKTRRIAVLCFLTVVLVCSIGLIIILARRHTNPQSPIHHVIAKPISENEGQSADGGHYEVDEQEQERERIV